LVNNLALFHKTFLLSGDNDSEKSAMRIIFGSVTNLHFNQSPKDKQVFVNHEKEDGSVVMMIGDGLNDAGAIKAADIGVAVADDVFSFSPACDVILQADQLQHLDAYISYIKKSISVVKVSVVISLLYNIVGLSFAVQGLLTPLVAAILMPLSSISVVLFVTLLTNILKPKN
jgi:Cu+-exporting ATPase